MHAKKNLYLLISLAVLSVTSVGLFWITRQESRPTVAPDFFQTHESEKINRVVLQSIKDTVELKFENNRWHVNGQWDADAQMIKVLFATLRQVEPRRPVAIAICDSVRAQLEKYGTRVILYEGDHIQADFFAGGNTLKTETWFLKEGDTQPFQVMIPGYRVYVAGILELAEGGWRNKRIFDFNWRNFRYLSASYPRDPNQNFEVEMKGGYFGIRQVEMADTARLNSYLDAMSLLFARRFVGSEEKHADSIVSSPPLARIEIKDIANRSYVLELFPPGINDSEILGRLASGQRVAFNKNDVAEIVKERDYFRVR